MMAAVLYGKEDIRIEPTAIPKLSEGDILVRVRAALTCGTDIKVFRRGYHAKMIVPPALFGHELAGDVAEVAQGVTKFRPGQRVVAANSAPCLECYYCRHGQENLCEDLLFNNGAYAEYIRIPARIVERNTYEIPANIDYRDAALMEPLACVARGFDETGLRAGDDLVIIGLGPIGSMHLRLAKSVGARVIAIDRRQSQLERAKLLGADEVISAEEHPDPVEAVRALTGGRGADVAIEAVGLPQTWELCTRLVRRGGTVNFFGGCTTDSTITLSTQLLHYSEISCKASFHHTPRHVRKALDLISRGVVTARDFVTRQEPLANLQTVLQDLSNQNGHLKAAIIP
jgi:L-iditol 2-dehydrogenase